MWAFLCLAETSTDHTALNPTPSLTISKHPLRIKAVFCWMPPLHYQHLLGHELAGTTPAFFVHAIIQRCTNKFFKLLLKMLTMNMTSLGKLIKNRYSNSWLLSF